MCYIKTGGRIKYYRYLLHLTQEELAMGRISTEMISLLENNKKKLTPITASILVSNFHEIANENGVQINFEIKDLLMSDADYANTLCNKWLEELEVSPYNETKYFEIIELAKEYNLNEPIFKVYEKMFSFYFNNNNYSKALNYIKKLLSLSILINNKNEEIIILNKFGTCYYMLQDYDKALFNYKMAYDKFLEYEINDPQLQDKLLYNLVLSSSALKNFDAELIYMEKLESTFNVNQTEMYTNLILKANILMKIDRIEEALTIYKDILNHDIKYLYIVQNNIAVAFMRLGKINESIVFFTKSINNQLHSLSPNTTISLTHLAEIYYKENRYEETFIFYGYCIDNAKKFKQLDELILCYENIYDLCKEMNKISKFDFYYKSIIDLYSYVSFNEEQIKRMQLLEQNYISNTI